MNSDNQTNNELSCQLCKTSHASEWELKEHLWSLLHHVKLEQKEKNTLHQCVLCLTSTANLVDYGRHLNDQKHKQVLEKAKEKKKAKPKAASSRHGLSKAGKQKSKKSLMPNPNWHLSTYNPHKQEYLKINKLQAQFGNWKARDDWQWKINNKFNPKMQGSDPQINNKQHWNNNGVTNIINNNNNNNNGFYWFNSSNKNPYECRNIPNHLPNSVVMESDQLNPSNKSKKPNAIHPLKSRKLAILSNHQHLKRSLTPNKTPPLSTKNSKSSTDSNGYPESQQLPLETSSIKSFSQAADNSKSATSKPAKIAKSKKLSPTALTSARPKVNPSSQVSKIKTNVSKLKSKGGIVKSAVNSKTEKQSQNPLFVIDKVGAKNATDKCRAEISKDVSKRKYIAPSVRNKSDNFSDASVCKTKPSPSPPKKPSPSPPKKKPQPKNAKQIEIPENKTKLCKSISPTEKKNSLVDHHDSDVKISGDINSKDDTTTLKRNFNSINTPKYSSSSNPNKKLKTLPKSDITELRKKTTKTDSPNILPATNSSGKQKTLLKTNSTDPNSSCVKVELGVLSALNPTKEQNTLSPLPCLEQNENSFKVNNELVTKLRKKLIGQNLMKLSNSNIESKMSSRENAGHSRDESSQAVKPTAGNVRQEELIKMMKLPRLSRKEKMHLSSLLQSYTKSQNKKLAVPRLTMQLSGLYDSSSSSADITDVAELQLPDGMEEQITYLIKRENLEALPGGHRNPESSTPSEKRDKQTAKEKDFPVSVAEKETADSQAGQLSPPDLSNLQIERLNSQCLSDVISAPVEPCSSQRNTAAPRENNAVCEPTNNTLTERNTQLENNSSSCTTLSNPPETSLQTNFSDPVTTGTQPSSSENVPTSNDTENVFSKVYSLTLREEQIRSSIVDMNEKMNYLRKLIEDSQMALQGCCIEHKRLLDEESNIRDQRLKILQNAMNGKGSSMDAINPSPPQQTPAPQSLPPQPVPTSHREPALPQTDLGQPWSSVSAQQSSLATQTLPNNPAVQPSDYFCGMSRGISSANRNGLQNQESSACSSSSLDVSSNLSTFQPRILPSSASPDRLPREPPIPPVCGSESNEQNQDKKVSPPLNPADTISFGSDATYSDKGISKNKNMTTNSRANTNQRKESPLKFGNITIKQEIPSPSTPPPPPPPHPQTNIKQTPTLSQDFVHNNTCNNSIPTPKTFSEEARVSEGRQIESTLPDKITETDRPSDNVTKQELPSEAAENETMNFEMVQIKKEPLTPPPPPPPSEMEPEESLASHHLPSCASGEEQQNESQLKIASIYSFHTKSHKGEQNHLSDEDTLDGIPEVLIENQLPNSIAEQSPCSPAGQTTDVQCAIDFESVQIKKEPLTPPPQPQVESEETFFVPRLPSADKKEIPDPSAENQFEFNTEIERTDENNSISSAKNLSGSDDQNDTSGNSGGMSMTYLGSMPNNFLEQLTLSWKKQNMSAKMIECSGPSNEHSFSDSESTLCSFIKKSTPKFSVPARMNPRVCLEPLNMKYHRKRTLSEPVSTSDSHSLSTGNLQQDGYKGPNDDLERLSSPKKSPDKKVSDPSTESDFIKAEETGNVEVKRRNLRSKSPERESEEDPSDLSTGKSSEPPAHLDIFDPLLNSRQTDLDSSDADDPRESGLCSTRPDDSSAAVGSDGKQNLPAGSAGDLQSTGAVSQDLKLRTDPLNILNNLNLLHVVRTKKFPRTHANGSQLPTYKGANNPVNGLYIFENHLYASYQGNSPYKFSLDTGKCLQIYNCMSFSVQCMLVCRISRNRTRLFSGGASEVLLVFDEGTGELNSHIDTGRKIYSLHENWGSLFVGLAEGGVTKINLKSMRKTSELSYGTKPINCLATCTEGAQKLLCVGAYDASILIVDAMTGLLLKTLNCYHRLLYAIKVHQNLIFSCSSDKTLQVHDITSGKLLHCLQDHTATISCIYVEDNLLVTGSHDKRINIYNSSNPREAPIIFYATSKEPISCLTVHNKIVYCGNFYGHIEAVQYEAAQKWICKYDTCELVFGQRKGLFYHLVNQHLQMTGLVKKKCLWENCGEFIYSVLDITEHCENHINQIVQSD